MESLLNREKVGKKEIEKLVHKEMRTEAMQWTSFYSERTGQWDFDQREIKKAT